MIISENLKKERENSNKNLIIEKNKVTYTNYKNLFSEEKVLFLPSKLERFVNISTDLLTLENGKEVYYFKGYLIACDDDYICDKCQNRMHINGSNNITLKHIPIGSTPSFLCFPIIQFLCPTCGNTHMQKIPFKAPDHLITVQANNYVESLLSTGNYTNKDVSYITNIGRNIVKDIDKKRLNEKYTVNGEGKELKKPEEYAKYLAVDEFKLHNGYKYATHIIDLDTGKVLWIQKGKKKKVVYDFIEHVGIEWMNHVEAIACDMNSDFEQAFRNKCPHINIVFDYFHIVKNFNEKVIGAIRKDEQKRLEDSGDKEAAKTLKRSKYILTSSPKTLIKKDKDADQNKTITKESKLFNLEEQTQRGGKVDKFNKIMKENKLLFEVDFIKEEIRYAYSLDDEEEMIEVIDAIIELCEEKDNKHFNWFANLLKNHKYGIITHAKYKISSGKIEGINNKIKTLRRQAYGYSDDEYFFLKIFDISRT